MLLTKLDFVTADPEAGRRLDHPGRAPAATTSTSSPRSIFTRYLLAFEVTSVLLVIAVVGAVVLARRPGGGQPAETEGAVTEKKLEAVR